MRSKDNDNIPVVIFAGEARIDASAGSGAEHGQEKPHVVECVHHGRLLLLNSVFPTTKVRVQDDYYIAKLRS